MLVQVTVSNGHACNVATEIDTEVYNKIASWYNEDKDTAGNGTQERACYPRYMSAFSRHKDISFGPFLPSVAVNNSHHLQPTN